MKIISWNINGIRSAEEQFLRFLTEYQPDMVFIQELRAHADQLSFFLKNPKGYSSFFNPSPRAGYAGTALYFRNELSDKLHIETTNDSILVEENRIIEIKYMDFTIINVYIPNGNSSGERLKYKTAYLKELIKYTSKFTKQGEKVILGGDINIAHTEKDLYNPAYSQKFSGFLPEERELFDDILKLGFIDTFRYFHKEGGLYTWWHMRDKERKMNKGWRFDYFFVTKDIIQKVIKSSILKDVFGSDHCPIFLDIKI